MVWYFTSLCFCNGEDWLVFLQFFVLLCKQYVAGYPPSWIKKCVLTETKLFCYMMKTRIYNQMKKNRKTVLSWAYKPDAVQYFPLWNSLDIKDQKLLMWNWGFTEIKKKMFQITLMNFQIPLDFFSCIYILLRKRKLLSKRVNTQDT